MSPTVIQYHMVHSSLPLPPTVSLAPTIVHAYICFFQSQYAFKAVLVLP